jgi:hypothetical protein
MYNYLYTEITKTDKEERKGFVLFPLLNYLKQAVYDLMDSYRFSQNNLSEEHDTFNLTINVKLQDSLLTKDYIKVITNFFDIYNELYYPLDYLFDIIEFSEIYFNVLEYFFQKRELKIGESQEGDESNSYGENDFSDDGDEDDSENSKDNIIIRDINVSDEAKCLVNYSIINCIIFN